LDESGDSSDSAVDARRVFRGWRHRGALVALAREPHIGLVAWFVVREVAADEAGESRGARSAKGDGAD